MIEELVASALGLTLQQVAATMKLIDGGATVPFISRYRKEATQGLDEVAIENIRLTSIKVRELEERKVYVLDVIREQGKLTGELEQKIKSCKEWNLLEDLYLPYKPKRKTRATVAKEQGLQPLADWLMLEMPRDVIKQAQAFLNDKVNSVEDALEGARDIIAELINEHETARSIIRREFEKNALIQTKVRKGKDDYRQSSYDSKPNRATGENPKGTRCHRSLAPRCFQLSGDLRNFTKYRNCRIPIRRTKFFYL